MRLKKSPRQGLGGDVIGLGTRLTHPDSVLHLGISMSQAIRALFQGSLRGHVDVMTEPAMSELTLDYRADM